MERLREYQAPLETFRLMELGNWAEAAREAATMSTHSGDKRLEMHLEAQVTEVEGDPA